MASGDSLLIFRAQDHIQPASNPAIFQRRNGTPVLEFDDTTQWVAIFHGVLPRHYTGGGIRVYLHFSAKTAVTGTLGWDVAFERIGDSQQDLDSDGFASAQTVTAVTVPGTSGHVDIQSVDVTDGAQLDGLLAGEGFRLRVRRDVANDTAAGNGQLGFVELVEV